MCVCVCVCVCVSVCLKLTHFVLLTVCVCENVYFPKTLRCEHEYSCLEGVFLCCCFLRHFLPSFTLKARETGAPGAASSEGAVAAMLAWRWRTGSHQTAPPCIATPTCTINSLQSASLLLCLSMALFGDILMKRVSWSRNSMWNVGSGIICYWLCTNWHKQY